MLSTLCELIGFGLIGYAAYLFAPVAGIAVCGFLCIGIGLAIERSNKQ